MTKAANLALCLNLLASAVLAQDPDPHIRIGEKLSLKSEVLDEDRPYWVYRPASYDDHEFGQRSYPVLYLLDGDAHFHSASGIVQFMSTGINGNIQIPELILVAIPNTNRTRDLTPTQSMIGYDGKESEFLGVSGGGDAFLKFVHDELIPRIEADYRTLPHRTLVGHSFGGLLALHALLDAPEMFQATIAIDPSLWWDDQVLVRRLSDRLQEFQNRRTSVYISLANNPALGKETPGLMRGAGRRFAGLLETTASRDLRIYLEYFEDEDHGSVPLLSLYQGLLHVFAGYKPAAEDLFEAPAALGAHFEHISERLGIQLLPPPQLVRQVGYFLLSNPEQAEKALELFKINLANFPNSSRVYQDLGEGLLASGKKVRAIESFEKSLALDPENEVVIKKLKELQDQS